MQSAFEELCELAPEGIQLTPGNAPTYDFDKYVAASEIPIRTHHGFTFTAMRKVVWSDGFEITGHWHSVHPPRKAPQDWMPRSNTHVIYETMYPGYPIGSGDALERAMNIGLRLAIDISHIYIQLEQNVLSDKVWRRLQDYPHIEEIHVSANNGRRDSHQPISRDTFGLEWARAKAKAESIPIILESYFHTVSRDERVKQMDIIKGKS